MIQAIWLVLLFPFSLYLTSAYIKPTHGKRNPRDLVAGLLGVASAAFFLHGTYSLIFLRLPHAAILFRTARGLAGGAFASALVSTVFSKGPRNMLFLAGALFVASPVALLIVLHRVAPSITPRTLLLSPRLVSLESWPMGLAIPAIIVLWRSHGNDSENADKGMGPVHNENEMEA